MSWRTLGNTAYWFVEGMGGGVVRVVGNFRSAFSTREAGGWLSTDGGWVFYVIDQAGVYCCGAAWPFVAGTFILFMATATTVPVV